MENSTNTKGSWGQFLDSTYYEMLSAAFRLILGGVFIAAAVTKIPDLHQFQLTVASYHILPLWAVKPFANALPFVELGLGVLVILGLFTKKATSGIMFLLVVFIAALTINLIRGQDAVCGCFGGDTNGAATAWKTIARDGILLLLGAHILLGRKFRFSLDSWRNKRRQSTLER